MKWNYRMSALPLLVMLALFACNTPPAESKTEDAKMETSASGTPKVDMDKLKVEIQAMEDAFAAGEKARSVDSVAAYYADDAVSYNRNEPPSVGKAAIREKIAKGFARDSVGDYNVYKIVDLFADGDDVTEIGSWTSMTAAGTKKENGYYMSYFQKRDGKYKCVRDMSVTESPAKK